MKLTTGAKNDTYRLPLTSLSRRPSLPQQHRPNVSPLIAPILAPLVTHILIS